MLSNVFSKHFHDCLLVCMKPNISFSAFNLFTSENYVSASTKISFKVMRFGTHVMELHQSTFLLIKGMNLEVMLMQNNAISSIMFEYIWINLFA